MPLETNEPKEWISARDALDMVLEVTSVSAANRSICKRCFDGLIRSRAERFIKHKEVIDNTELPSKFWWAKGEAALEQNWATGDFETWINKSYHWRAYGVEFFKADIVKLLPPKETEIPEKTNLVPDGITVVDVEYDERSGDALRPRVSDTREEQKTQSKGGRPMGEWWADWVAELALYIDTETLFKESGRYKTQSEVIEDVANSLSEKGHYVPDNSTVQPIVRAVFQAFKSRKN